MHQTQSCFLGSPCDVLICSLNTLKVLRVLVPCAAVGSINNTFGIKGVAEHTIFFKSIEDANRLRRQVSECFERAALPHTSQQVTLPAGFPVVGSHLCTKSFQRRAESARQALYVASSGLMFGHFWNYGNLLFMRLGLSQPGNQILGGIYRLYDHQSQEGLLSRVVCSKVEDIICARKAGILCYVVLWRLHYFHPPEGR